MSQNNVREALSQLEREARRSVETHLANIEASFDLGYLQTEDGWSSQCYLMSTICEISLSFFTDFCDVLICFLYFTSLLIVKLLEILGYQADNYIDV